ncbi:Glycosyl hydrolases family 32 N-terminal domain-containing protein [Thalassobacillus cyri]|uniref:Glycosyl hydrolases family 32 N-terminal domain-containing protein n=1 Tax=Thalassobacillus cyri TaxID=571932 RepID=A0A1H4ABJ0_9BACI|nr:LamG-like jellyroll fold domain-containing protein [Thalassobacillus cyri]SEA33128.1 Glycosyl hydrolases family 32 N-terminal domain-containing protein [Thalassobacillus cyri]
MIRRKNSLYILLSFLLLLTAIPNAFVPSATAAEADGLILHYDMKAISENGDDKIIPDVAGDGAFDGTFKNPDNGQLMTNGEAGYVAFNGGDSNSDSGYIEIPKNEDGADLLSGLEDVTVSALVNWTNDGANRWIYGFGKVSSDIANGNSYFFATPRHGSNNTAAAGISEAGWRSEALIRGNQPLESGSWQVMTTVFSGSDDTLTLYVNGQEVATGSAQGKKLADIIDSSADFSGFIGKSIFQNDSYFKGMIGDFRVYNKALNPDQVAALSVETAEKADQINQLVLDDAAQSLDVSEYLAEGDASTKEITKDLTLPGTGKYGVAVSWSSSDTNIISYDGTVTRPAAGEPAGEVELTADLSYEGLETTKTFDVVVLSEYTDRQKAELDADDVIVYNQDNVKGNLHLATDGENGSAITWGSSHPDIIKGTAEAVDDPNKLGVVNRPEIDTEVTLTATISSGEAEIEKTFDVTVIADPGEKEYDAYFFSYFTGEYEGGEEISFATAKDPLHWEALNNGQSVIQSTMGEKGLRDPFVMRSPEGDKFYMIATDLKMGESTNFDQAQITGSHSIMVWESDDLVNWSEQRMVEVAPENGGNTWAPEAFYNEKTGEYVVFWASSIPNEETYGNYPNGRPNGQYNVMYYATTRDFYEFSEPKVMIDDSFPTIDTSFIQDGETLYRFTKSEVNYKVYYEKATNIFDDLDGIEENGFQFEPVAGTKDGNRGLIGHGGNNEGQTVFKDIHEDKWYLFLDSWPYHVRWTTDLSDGEQLVNNVVPASEYALPPGPRHGTVIPITNEEYDALQEKCGMDSPKSVEKPVVHYTFDGDDIDGETVKDVSGNGHDAQLVGGATIDSDAVDLDGSTGYVEMPENLIQDLVLENMTMSTWVQVDSDQEDQRIFDFSSETGRVANRNTMYLSTKGDTGSLEFAVVTPFTEKFGSESSKLGASYKYALRAASMSTGEWHHVAVTMNDFNASLYVDGEEVANSSVFNMEPRMLMETTLNALGKSRRDAHSLFDGKFDDFRVYNRALSANEIAELTESADKSAPTAPTNVDASAISANEIELNWKASTDNVGVTDYTVYRDGKQVVKTTETTFKDTSLTDATTYEYTITASDAAGNVSEASESVSATTKTSLSYLQEYTDQYVENGEVEVPLVKKLTNSLKQVLHHQAKGHEEQAVKHLENYVYHLEQAKTNQLSDDAKAALNKRAELLIDQGLE